MSETAEITFANQCVEAGEKIVSVLCQYPKPVIVCVLPGILASLMKALGLPRELINQMIDTALEDLEGIEDPPQQATEKAQP